MRIADYWKWAYSLMSHLLCLTAREDGWICCYSSAAEIAVEKTIHPVCSTELNVLVIKTDLMCFQGGGPCESSLWVWRSRSSQNFNLSWFTHPTPLWYPFFCGTQKEKFRLWWLLFFTRLQVTFKESHLLAFWEILGIYCHLLVWRNT